MPGYPCCCDEVGTCPGCTCFRLLFRGISNDACSDCDVLNDFVEFSVPTKVIRAGSPCTGAGGEFCFGGKVMAHNQFCGPGGGNAVSLSIKKLSASTWRALVRINISGFLQTPVIQRYAKTIDAAKCSDLFAIFTADDVCEIEREGDSCNVDNIEIHLQAVPCGLQECRGFSCLTTHSLDFNGIGDATGNCDQATCDAANAIYPALEFVGEVTRPPCSILSQPYCKWSHATDLICPNTGRGFSGAHLYLAPLDENHWDVIAEYTMHEFGRVFFSTQTLHEVFCADIAGLVLPYCPGGPNDNGLCDMTGATATVN